MAGEIAGFGASLAFGSGGTPTAIAGLIEANPEGFTYTQIKLAALDDASRDVSFINGRGTPPKLNCTYQYNETNYAAWVALKGHAAPYNYIYTLADGGAITGTANLETLGLPESPEDDRVTYPVVLQLNTMTYTPPA